MEKALHDYFYISKGSGPLILYSKDDASFLLDAANIHIERANGLDNQDHPQMLALETFIHDCMVEYYQNGVSEILLEMLNNNLANVRHQCLMEIVEKKLVPVYVGYLPHNPPQHIFAAYMFSNITSLGGLEGLKRCKSTDCQKFFIGRSNVKWCSKACGSRSRVKKMRKKKYIHTINQYYDI